MPFNSKAFMKTKFKDRTEAVVIPELKSFFAEKESPVFLVRGLTGEEFAVCQQSADKTRGLLALVEALNGSAPEQAAALKKAMGLDRDEVPVELIYRFEVLELGCVEPSIDRETAVKLAENFPTDVYKLTNKILHLTGLGREPGKPGGSGTTQESEPA